MFDAWSDNDTFEAFCRFLNNYAGHTALQSGYGSLPVFNRRHQPISHALLAADGFVVGNFVKCGKDEEVIDSSRYAIYEVPPGHNAPRLVHTLPVLQRLRGPVGRPIPGEYVAILFHKQLQTYNHRSALEVRVMCMLAPAV